MICVIGGGPAGFFAALSARQADPLGRVVLLERGKEVLRKVTVSGGGRCNVTHACFDPRALSRFYPRGGREMIGPLTRFGPAETEQWFAEHGVDLKTENDGRMFPVSDSSATIVQCLTQAARSDGVEVRTGTAVAAIERRGDSDGFDIHLAGGDSLACKAVILATGGQTSAAARGSGLDLAAALGHTIEPPVPSLFTFKSQSPLLQELAGVAVPDVALQIKGPGLSKRGLTQTGPLLITHWGVSGPAVLQLSSRGARALHDMDYEFELGIAWWPDHTTETALQALRDWAAGHGRHQVTSGGPTPLPRRLWGALCTSVGIANERKWAELGRIESRSLAEALCLTRLPVQGKATFKEEFVTCGGLRLKEIDFQTMGSRVCPGLFAAGEVLDIDGLTGGFNFQACWTTGWLAGQGAAAVTSPTVPEA